MNHHNNKSISLGVLLAGIMGALLTEIVVVQSAAADSVAGAFEIIIVSDDIRKGVTPTMRPGDGDGGDAGTLGQEPAFRNPRRGAASETECHRQRPRPDDTDPRRGGQNLQNGSPHEGVFRKRPPRKSAGQHP